MQFNLTTNDDGLTLYINYQNADERFYVPFEARDAIERALWASIEGFDFIKPQYSAINLRAEFERFDTARFALVFKYHLEAGAIYTLRLLSTEDGSYHETITDVYCTVME